MKPKRPGVQSNAPVRRHVVAALLALCLSACNAGEAVGPLDNPRILETTIPAAAIASATLSRAEADAVLRQATATEQSQVK